MLAAPLAALVAVAPREPVVQAQALVFRVQLVLELAAVPVQHLLSRQWFSAAMARTTP